jgi:lysophospholipase L1-like esterase
LLGSLGFTLIVAELALRLIGFSYYLYPQRVEFGWPTPSVIYGLYKPDPDLFWVLQDYEDRLAEFSAQGPAVAFLGDSCTQWGEFDVGFVERVQQLHGETLSTLNVGVGGWSSYQGLVQLERDILPLAPRSVVIYFGWNDHWIGFGVEDEQVARVTGSPLYWMQRARVVQLVTKALVRGSLPSWDRDRLEDPTGAGTEVNLRVPEASFRGNLTRMVEVARENGIRPMLVTAPSSHRVGEEPEELAERHIARLDDLVPLHQRYVAAVRDVALSTGVALCDLAAVLDPPREGLPGAGEHFDPAVFVSDGIHLDEAGTKRVAQELVDCFEREGLLKELL